MQRAMQVAACMHGMHACMFALTLYMPLADFTALSCICMCRSEVEVSDRAIDTSEHSVYGIKWQNASYSGVQCKKKNRIATPEHNVRKRIAYRYINIFACRSNYAHFYFHVRMHFATLFMPMTHVSSVL